MLVGRIFKEITGKDISECEDPIKVWIQSKSPDQLESLVKSIMDLNLKNMI
jgi:hypothetical protein